MSSTPQLRRLSIVLLLSLWLLPQARADVTLLLEEPYSYDGSFAGTGHTAVYLSRICAESPTVLRRCLPGEQGVVLSRYHGVAGYDWLAIPLIPYLYAVERPEDIPLVADAKIVAALRDHYRREHFANIIPDTPTDEMPSGNWYELVGSAYDRTIYGYQIETSEEKDEQFIAEYNTAPNRMKYKLVTRNCADFVREVVNFYYPKAVGRSFLADLEVTTPKHAAKSLVKYAHKHPDLQLSTFVVPQVPGAIKRSTPVHGVVDSVFKEKKYELPLLAFHPFVAAGIGLDYWISGRFNPAKNALIVSPDGTAEPPLTPEQRRAYEKGLRELLSAEPGKNPEENIPTWKQFQAKAQLRFDAEGQPFLEGQFDESTITIGLSHSNVLTASSQRDLTREMLVSRLREELRKGHAPKISDAQLRSDWKLLKSAIPADQEVAKPPATLSAVSSGSTD